MFSNAGTNWGKYHLYIAMCEWLVLLYVLAPSVQCLYFHFPNKSLQTLIGLFFPSSHAFIRLSVQIFIILSICPFITLLIHL